jgi:hypothetical protein
MFRGCDVNSRIVTGMSRTVDVLEVMRRWGDGDSEAGRSRRRMQQTSSRDKEWELSSGKSDATVDIINDFNFRAWWRRRACRQIPMFCKFRD